MAVADPVSREWVVEEAARPVSLRAIRAAWLNSSRNQVSPYVDLYERSRPTAVLYDGPVDFRHDPYCCGDGTNYLVVVEYVLGR